MNNDDCPRIDALSALADDALAGAERAEIETHAGGCAVCGHALDRLRGLRADFVALSAPRVGCGLAPAVAERIRAAERMRPAGPTGVRRREWWQGLPVALGTAAALGAGAYLGAFLVVGGGVAATRPAIERSAFGTVPPGGLCLGPACQGGR